MSVVGREETVRCHRAGAAEAKIREADRLECEAWNAIMWAGGTAMPSPGDPQAEPGPAASSTTTGGSMNGETTGPTGRPSGDGAMQKNMGTTGSGRGDPNGGNPNGTAGGLTSLSGTGSSQYGGNGTAGITNGR